MTISFSKKQYQIQKAVDLRNRQKKKSSSEYREHDDYIPSQDHIFYSFVKTKSSNQVVRSRPVLWSSTFKQVVMLHEFSQFTYFRRSTNPSHQARTREFRTRNVTGLNNTGKQTPCTKALSFFPDFELLEIFSYSERFASKYIKLTNEKNNCPLQIWFIYFNHSLF